MIAQDALAGLEAGLITEAEALEQAGAEDVDGIRDVVGEVGDGPAGDDD